MKEAVVIGAGFAGLSACVRLLQEGYAVRVLEQNTVVGGKAEGWQGIATGPTVMTMPEILVALFAKLGADAPVFSPVQPTTQYHYPDGRTFSAYSNQMQHLTLQQLDAQETKDYTRLLEIAQNLYEGAKNTFLFAPPPQIQDLMRYGLTHGLRAYPHLKLPQLVRSGKHLTPFFLRFATYMGANPYTAPAVLHNIAHVELGLGVWHSQGGFAAIAQELFEALQHKGVQFEFGCTVQRLEINNNRVQRIHTNMGIYHADHVVSAVDRHFTLAWLGKPMPRYPLTVSGLTLQLHLAEDMGLSHHIVFSGDYGKEWVDIDSGRLPADPTVYLHTAGRTAFVMVNSPPNPALATREYALTLLRQVQQQFGFTVNSYQVLSAADYARTGLNGALYGRAPVGLLGTLRPAWHFSHIHNLRQVGGTVHPGGGVPLSVVSGFSGAVGEYQHLNSDLGYKSGKGL